MRNDEELQHVQRQVNRVELIVRSQREEISSESNFRLFTESAVDMLKQLRDEIDDYLGIPVVMKAPEIAAEIHAEAALKCRRDQIQSHAGLSETQEALANMEQALASLKRAILPKNERNFQVFAQTYVTHIMALRAQIDEYLGISKLSSRPQPLAPTGS
jgi:hypothetical protein